MTDLSKNLPVGVSTATVIKDTAAYFQCHESWVAEAIHNGAKTYQEVYNLVCKKRAEHA